MLVVLRRLDLFVMLVLLYGKGAVIWHMFVYHLPPSTLYFPSLILWARSKKSTDRIAIQSFTVPRVRE